MAKRSDFTLNFRFIGNAQAGTAVRRGANAARGARGRFQSLDDFARIVVDRVALNSANRTFQAARQSLARGVRAEIGREISRMASYIGRFSIQPDGATGPKGNVRSAQTLLSDQARSLWGNNNVLAYNVANSDARWRARSRRYLAKKTGRGYTSDWWKMTGALSAQLSNASLYDDFGPISVTFSRAGQDIKGRVKQTTSGRSGRVSETYQIGRLDVAVFGRITPAMLPSLLDSLTGGVNEVTPHGAYLPELFKNRDVRNKLMSHGKGEYRPVVEPFLSYYLTRAIPNAVFNRTEKLIKTDVGSAGRTRR